MCMPGISGWNPNVYEIDSKEKIPYMQTLNFLKSRGLCEDFLREKQNEFMGNNAFEFAFMHADGWRQVYKVYRAIL